MDYQYLLYFQRDARVEVLEHLAAMADDADPGPTTLVLPDRRIRLPFADWGQGGTELARDAPDPWSFMTVLRFPPDPPLEDYVRRLRTGDQEADPYDDQGRLRIGFVYLGVRDEPGTTGNEGLVRFSFGTPGSSMSVLFMESDSIRSAMQDLLEHCRGVYGILDMEDYADLIWLRGERRDDRLPTSEMSLAEIEAFLADGAEGAGGPEGAGVATAAPLPFSFAAEQVIAAAKHLCRIGKGSDLCVNHWQVALRGGDDRQALAREGLGSPLAEDQVRDRATRHAREAARTLVSTADIAAVVAEAARSG